MTQVRSLGPPRLSAGGVNRQAPLRRQLFGPEERPVQQTQATGQRAGLWTECCESEVSLLTLPDSPHGQECLVLHQISGFPPSGKEGSWHRRWDPSQICPNGPLKKVFRRNCGILSSHFQKLLFKKSPPSAPPHLHVIHI